jgi:cAMP phosphodiesterase
MQIRVLGCSGSIAAGSRTTSFLVDDDLLVDAGTGMAELELEAMAAINDILITHSHLDHILGIGLMADTVSRRRAGRGPIRVHALPATLEALRKHIFNGVIWPDFTRLPSAEDPLVSFVPFAVGESLTLGARRVEVLPAEHTVPAVGFAIAPREPGAASWVFTGDTGPNPALWRRLTGMNIAHLVIETAFGNEDQALARISAHLCPTTLERELARLEGDVQVYITHIKPGEVDTVMQQIEALPMRHRCTALQPGQVFTLGVGE